MKNTGTLKVVAQGDREVLMTRVFDAPRQLVFDALTKPELLKRWFGPHGWTLVECDIDLRVGGAWRFLSHGPDGRVMGMHGVYREIAPPGKLQYTESFDEFASAGAALVTATLDEREGKTILTTLVLSPSREVRDGVLRSGMEHGAAETYDRLAELLPSLAATQRA
ncbi:MAG TPA: SRPBCC family protein [Rhodanobacteraceae bacterium]|jgi:uncharacterized protein YndB with AHSA1/START domain|nr:SRPBCC family protein [Rhodanobacteraceae bacterium]